MSADNPSPPNPAPLTPDQLLAETLRENERLRRHLADTRHERDEFKQLYLSEAARNDPKLTAEDIAAAVPARPVIDDLIRRLEQP
jgi:hypothetical protein